MSLLGCCRKVIVLSPLLILLLASCATDQHGGGGGEEFFFESNGLLDSEFLHLRSDGTLVKYTRMHFLTREDAHGSWQRSPGGDFELRSVWMRQVVHGPIRIAGFGKEWRHRLAVVSREIEGYLRENKEASLAGCELEKLGTWSSVDIVLEGTEYWSTNVPISVKIDSVDRTQVEGALKAIDEYLGQDDKDVVHARLVPHKGREFLHWLDGGPRFVDRTVDEMRQAIDRDDPLELSYSPFYRIAKKDLEQGIRECEPFKFLPDPRK